MGNCSLKGSVNEAAKPIRVLTDSGIILTFHTPKLVREVTQDFRGYGIFKRGQASTPLHGEETLLSSNFYYLLPLKVVKEMVPVGSGSSLASSGGLEVVRHNGKGVWKVKLVIGSKELEEILAEEGNVEALVERMREAAAAATVGRKPNRGKTNRLNVLDRVSSHC